MVNKGPVPTAFAGWKVASIKTRIETIVLGRTGKVDGKLESGFH